MKKLSLIKMKKNQKGKVYEVTGGGNLSNRLMSMGIYQGCTITKLSHFALRGPVAVRIVRTVIALGHGVASKVMVEIE